MLDDVHEIGPFFRRGELKQVSKQIESLAVRAVNNEGDTYRSEFRREYPDEGRGVNLVYPNLHMIVQDTVITPIAVNLARIYCSSRTVQSSDNYLLGGQDSQVVSHEGLSIGRPTPKQVFDARYVARKLAPKLQEILNQDEDDRIWRGRAFHLANDQGRFAGINLDGFVRGELGGSIVGLMEGYLRENYIAVQDSQYLDREARLISKPGGCFVPDIFCEGGFRIPKITIGTLEEYAIPKVEDDESNRWWGRDTDLTFEPEGNVRRVLQSLANEITEHLVTDAKRVSRDLDSSFVEESYFGGTYKYSVHSFLRESIFGDFDDGLKAWINGQYYTKEGIFVNPTGRTLVLPSKEWIATDWASNSRMDYLSKSAIKRGFKYLSDNSESGHKMLKSGCGSACLFQRFNAPSLPKETIDFRVMADAYEHALHQMVWNNLRKLEDKPKKIPGELYFRESDLIFVDPTLPEHDQDL